MQKIKEKKFLSFLFRHTNTKFLRLINYLIKNSKRSHLILKIKKKMKNLCLTKKENRNFENSTLKNMIR